MKREIKITGKTINVLCGCLNAQLREGIDSWDLEDFIKVRDFINDLIEIYSLGVDLEDNPVILNVKG